MSVLECLPSKKLLLSNHMSTFSRQIRSIIASNECRHIFHDFIGHPLTGAFRQWRKIKSATDVIGPD